MAAQRQIPGGSFINETGARQAQIPGGSYLNESGVTIRSASVTLVDTEGAASASLTGLKWAWFDQITPDLFAGPTDFGVAETTDNSGALTVLLPNTAKSAGDVGWLIVTDSDGNPATAHKAFSGPVQVN
jgi:hypothetical protein